MSRRPEDMLHGSDRLLAGQVGDFLRRNPSFLTEFLDRNSHLVAQIAPAPKDRGDGVVDLQTFMVGRLRAEVGRLHKRLEEVVDTSRSNLSAQALIHEACLGLLDAASIDELIDIVTSDLAMMLSVDVATFCIECAENPLPAARTPGVFLLEAGTVDAVIGPQKDVRLDAKIVGHQAIFGPAAGLVKSQALLRVHISHEAPLGLLALGTREEGHFHPSQGTELLCFLARVVGSTLRAWLRMPH